MRRSVHLLALLAALAAIPASARDLHWKSIAVDAKLDQNGTLHVTEVQKIVFTGDWNGGERRFDVGFGQTFGFEGMDRIADDGSVHPLHIGDLDAVDGYGVSSDHDVRWRSRLPTDPDFDSTTLTYALHYHYGNVVRHLNEKDYLLNHDFAFSDREGVIEHFTLHLEIEPPWHAAQPAVDVTKDQIEPGIGVVVRVPLTWTGAGVPSDIRQPAPAALRYLLLALLTLGVIVIMIRYRRAELESGRLGPMTPMSEITPDWLQQNVFRYLPELVGAAWDEKTGSPEVAAVLARMTQEQKLRSHVDKAGRFSSPVLHLELLESRSALSGYELALVDAFFFDGGNTTDTTAIRSHYSSTGFSPASLLKGPLKNLLGAIPNWNKEGSTFPTRRVVWSLVGAFILMALACFGGATEIGIVSGVMFISVFVTFIAGMIAFSNRNAVLYVLFRTVVFSLFLIPMFAYVVPWYFATAAPPHLLTLLAISACALAVMQLVFETGTNREVAAKIAFRKKLTSARQFFEEQLKQKNPALQDDWFPYLLAFGLGSNVDQWFSSFGSGTGSAVGAAAFASSGFSSGSSDSGSSGWTGGGGAFGGAGASGSWAGAASSLSSGVSAPSSSGGSGGGGGGGGSSGGGGGGGW